VGASSLPLSGWSSLWVPPLRRGRESEPRRCGRAQRRSRHRRAARTERRRPFIVVRLSERLAPCQAPRGRRSDPSELTDWMCRYDAQLQIARREPVSVERLDHRTAVRSPDTHLATVAFITRSIRRRSAIFARTSSSCAAATIRTSAHGRLRSFRKVGTACGSPQ